MTEKRLEEAPKRLMKYVCPDGFIDCGAHPKDTMREIEYVRADLLQQPTSERCAVVEGPSSTEYDAWLKTRPDIVARFRTVDFTPGAGYEIWRNSWLRLREMGAATGAGEEAERDDGAALAAYRHEYERLFNWRDLWNRLSNSNRFKLASQNDRIEAKAARANRLIGKLIADYDAGVLPAATAAEDGRVAATLGVSTPTTAPAAPHDDPRFTFSSGGVDPSLPTHCDHGVSLDDPCEQCKQPAGAIDAVNAAATEICDYCGIDTNDAEKVAAIISKRIPDAGEVERLRVENRQLKMIVDVGTGDDPGTALKRVRKIESDARALTLSEKR